MEYEGFRESLQTIKKLAENYTNLNQSELNELNRLNSQCLTMKEGIVNSFKSVLGELEDGLTMFIDRLEYMKKDIDRISGPEGTLEDTLQLESTWKSTQSLLNNMRTLLEPGTESPDNKDGKSDTRDIQGKTIHELVAIARNEAAIATEKSTAAKLPAPEALAPPKTLKNEGQDQQVHNKRPEEQGNGKKASQKKEHKATHTGHFSAKPLSVHKACGDTEKKIIDEISKNMELIKNNKKKI